MQITADKVTISLILFFGHLCVASTTLVCDLLPTSWDRAFKWTSAISYLQEGTADCLRPEVAEPVHFSKVTRHQIVKRMQQMLKEERQVCQIICYRSLALGPALNKLSPWILTSTS
jgi:hypothetical protein